MPALDINLVQQLGRDLHSVSPGYMGEDEVCPWTLFLTMALTLLKGKNKMSLHENNIFVITFYQISNYSI